MEDTGCMEERIKRARVRVKTPKGKEKEAKEVKEKELRASTVDNQDIWPAIARIPIHIKAHAPVVGIRDIQPSSAITIRDYRISTKIRI